MYVLVQLSTAGGRTFSVAGTRIWNSLRDHVTSAEIFTHFPGKKHIFLNVPLIISVPSSVILLRPLKE